MSSDGYFDNDDLDAATLDQLDAIEAALKSPGIPVKPVHHNPPPITKETSFYDLTLEIDDEELQRLDEFIEDTYQGKARPIAGPSKTGTHQTTLFGDILPSTSKPRSQIRRTKSTPRNPFGQQAPKTKEWDQTAFAKTGLKRGKSKGKGKATFDHEDEDEEEEIEFEQFPAPFVPSPPPMKLSPDLLEAKHWIYPLNRPKRDYQYNIVKHCLFENTIVALPTGLGKTFIAGVVMLNYYRWFPDGKVVFVAPTKPLVAQQIDACHQTCGIPGTDAAELTGQIPKAVRGKTWKEKRVFYMTPQTLINDLVTENCDVRDIILIVIDEAHRATGGYAYNQVIRFLMAKNPYFRVLALTATPGSNPEAVQLLIDGLHISRIDIRDENSLDLKPFIHHKTIKQHIITMTEDIDKVKDLLAQLMDTDMKPLRQRGVLFGSPDPVKMHPYSAQARMGTLNKDQRWAYGPLARLSSLARAMGYLIEGTMGMCYTYLQEISRDKGDEENAGPGQAAASKSKKLRNDPLFQAIMQELEHQRSRGFSVHPKMDLLKTLIVQHFAENLADERVDERDNDETRAMVFVTFREAVDEIVEALNFESPLVRASKFIGQGTDKQGRKGLAQKEQLEVVKKFKAGEFNVLVATSIGEEGLDIGEVDLIVCYDAQKTPIRMLQRVGRTGRKRAGFVHVLLAEGREELNFDKAKDTHKEVQKTILRGDQLELYADVKRLLPEHIKPACLEIQMEIQEYVRDEGKRNKMDSGRSPTKGIKRKRNDDVLRNVPTGASTGFVSVAELVIKGSKKKKAPVVKDLALAGQDDDTDMELESGAVVLLPRRTKSVAVSKPDSRTKLRKAATMDGPKSRKKKIEKVVEPTSSQFSSKGADDEHDLEIEGGIGLSFANHARLEESDKLVDSTHVTDSSTGAVVDLSSSYGDNPTKQGHQSMAWLIDDDDDPDIEIMDSSPIISRKLPAVGSATDDDSIEFVEPPISPSKFSNSPSWINSMDSEAPRKPGVSASRTKAQDHSNRPGVSSRRSEDMEVVPDSDSSDDDMTTGSPHGLQPSHLRTKVAPRVSLSPVQPHQSGSEQDDPDASFPVQPIIKQRKWPRIEQELSSSPILDMPPPSQRRLHRRHGSPAQRRLRKQNRSRPNFRSDPLLFDIAAMHSGDETSEGSSDPENDIEDESDQLFLQPMAETQLSPSYDQTLAYRQSLFTQAPAGSKAPVFGNCPVRNGMFRIGDTNSRRISFVPSSPSNGEPDEYAFGSFVVDDEAEISYLSSE